MDCKRRRAWLFLILIMTVCICCGCGDFSDNASEDLQESSEDNTQASTEDTSRVKLEDLLTPMTAEEAKKEVEPIVRSSVPAPYEDALEKAVTEDEIDPEIEDFEFKADVYIRIGRKRKDKKEGEEQTDTEIYDDTMREFDEGVDHAIGLVGDWGIDVSKYNKDINWSAVRDAGVSYAIIRCGYRGYTGGQLVIDPYWERNIQGANDAGVKAGVYFFTQAITIEEAVEEAGLVYALIKDKKIDYPVFIDVEGSGGRADLLDNDTRTAVVSAFVDTIKAYGYDAGVYANKKWFTTKLNTYNLPEGCYKWLAQYNVTEPTYDGSFHMWQYSSKGAVPGITGYVDVNQSYISR